MKLKQGKFVKLVRILPKVRKINVTLFKIVILDKTYPKNYFKPKNISSFATLLTRVKNACIFCDLNFHDFMNCRKLDIEQKISKLKSDGRCWVCFKSK